MRLGLSVYGTVYSMGLHPQANRPTITPLALMKRARAMGLAGVEFPADWIKDDPVLETVKSFAGTHDLFIVLDTGGFQSDKLREVLNLASRVGAETVRTVVGGAGFGGDRRPMAGRWQGYLEQIHEGLAGAIGFAEQIGVNLAVENHQDIASEELLWLSESLDSPNFGVNLDTGNPLATAEEPGDYFRRVMKDLRNVHLKDYKIFLSEEGYRLVRCPIGQGVIDFPELFAELQIHQPNITMSIEMGALEARHTRVLAEDFWPEYPPRTAAQLANLMRFVQAHAQPMMADWRTPYERGESATAIAQYEEHELSVSLAYLSGTLGGLRS